MLQAVNGNICTHLRWHLFFEKNLGFDNNFSKPLSYTSVNIG